MRRDSDPTPKMPEDSNLKELAKSAHYRVDCPRSLRKNVREQYIGSATDQALASVDLGGGRQEAITHLMMVGDTLLAVSRQTSGDGEYNSLDSVRLSVLSVNGESKKGSATTLLEVSPDVLRTPREDGIIQPYEQITIGRGDIAQRTLINDEKLSRAHGTMTVKPDGSFTVIDSSSNGTEIITVNDFHETHHGLSTGGQYALMAVVESLQENPYQWLSAYADSTVIYDAQQ